MADIERLRLLRRMTLEALRAAQVGTARGWMSVRTLRGALNRYEGDYSETEVGQALVFLAGKGFVEELRQLPADRDQRGRSFAITASGVELLDGTINEDPSIA